MYIHAAVFLPAWISTARLPPPSVICDATHNCSAGTTCCATVQGSWGCCKAANATCCADMMHCCPSKFPVCDAGKCKPPPTAAARRDDRDGQSVAWLGQLLVDPGLSQQVGRARDRAAASGTTAACCGCIGDNGNADYDQSCVKNCTPIAAADVAASVCLRCISGGRINGTLDRCAAACGCPSTWHCTSLSFHRCRPDGTASGVALGTCRATCGPPPSPTPTPPPAPAPLPSPAVVWPGAMA
jgi:hypothetical protein